MRGMQDASHRPAARPINVNELARRTGQHPKTVYLHLRQGLWPAFRRGGRWVGDPDRIEAALSGRLRPPFPEAPNGA